MMILLLHNLPLANNAAAAAAAAAAVNSSTTKCRLAVLHWMLRVCFVERKNT